MHPTQDNVVVLVTQERSISNSNFIKYGIINTHDIHFATDAAVPIVPKHGYTADAYGDRPGGAHQETSHQLGHVPAVVQGVHDGDVSVILNVKY